MKLDWRALDEAIERHGALCWWRDDDAVAPSPALDRLMHLAETANAPLLIASIPMHATEALAARLANAPAVEVAVHGYAHINQAPAGEKKAEFGAHRPLATLAAEAASGKTRIAALFGAQAVPIFVPPWNRMGDALVPALQTAGFSGYSTFAHTEPLHSPLPRFDALIDPIDWRGSRSAVAPQTLVSHTASLIRQEVPIGLMTHHLVHDDAIWALCEALVRRLSERGGRWIRASALFSQRDAGSLNYSQ